MQNFYNEYSIYKLPQMKMRTFLLLMYYQLPNIRNCFILSPRKDVHCLTNKRINMYLLKYINTVIVTATNMKTYQQEAYSQLHSRLQDSDQSHLLDTFQSFEQYHDLSVYSVHGLIHITFLLLALSNQTDSGCLRVRHLNQIPIQIINSSKNELIVLLPLYLITVQQSNYNQNNLIFTDLLLV